MARNNPLPGSARGTTRRIRMWSLGGATCLWLAVFLSTNRAGADLVAAAQPLQDDRATKAFVRMCSDCHEPERIQESRRTRGGWEEVIEKMIEKGASGSDQDFDLVLQYLLKNLGMVN